MSYEAEEDCRILRQVCIYLVGRLGHGELRELCVIVVSILATFVQNTRSTTLKSRSLSKTAATSEALMVTEVTWSWIVSSAHELF